ncbi:MAG: radical SAM protein [Candidatus Omnitrophota bacterium]
MKILLINPPFTQYASEVEIQADEPLGLMYLAAYLKEKNINVEILDVFMGLESIAAEDNFFRSGISDEEIKNKIIEYNPDIVGIASMFTMHSKGVHDVAKIIKSVSQDILVIVGGSHASSLPEVVLEDDNIDIVVMGEGEETLVEIINKFKEKQDIFEIFGTAIRQNNKIKINKHREFIKDMDTLPYPARDLVDMSVYLNDKYRNLLAMATPRANVITSRGCPYYCPYCSIHSIWKHSWRAISAKKVVDEIEFLVKKYGIREIAFQDDNLTLDKKRMHQICDEILKRKLNIKWCTPNGVAIWTLDKELLRKMKRSGCYKLTFGIETGSLNTQRFIRKTHIDLEKSKEIIRYCNKIGMWTHSAFIIGFPYETKEDIEETINYAISSDLDLAAFFIATPFPGTELYSLYRDEGLLDRGLGDSKQIKWIGCQQRPMCNTKYFKREELEEYLRDAHKRFYHSRIYKFMNPLRLLRKFTGLSEIKYFLKLLRIYNTTVGNLTN